MIVLVVFVIVMLALLTVAAYLEERLGWGADEPDFVDWAEEAERSWQR